MKRLFSLSLFSDMAIWYLSQTYTAMLGLCEFPSFFSLLYVVDIAI